MTTSDRLQRTRLSYDEVAHSYHQLLREDLVTHAADRAQLDEFCRLLGANAGPVLDAGCGPGRITGYLAAAGLDVCGIDLSPVMIDIASREYPELTFMVGDLHALELPDASTAGVVAWYSIIHTPPQELPAILRECARVLRPGGRLLLAYKVGDDGLRHLTSGYGEHQMDLDVYWFRPDTLRDALCDSGFRIESSHVRPPLAAEKDEQGYLHAIR